MHPHMYSAMAMAEHELMLREAERVGWMMPRSRGRGRRIGGRRSATTTAERRTRRP